MNAPQVQLSTNQRFAGFWPAAYRGMGIAFLLGCLLIKSTHFAAAQGNWPPFGNSDETYNHPPPARSVPRPPAPILAPPPLAPSKSRVERKELPTIEVPPEARPPRPTGDRNSPERRPIGPYAGNDPTRPTTSRQTLVAKELNEDRLAALLAGKLLPNRSAVLTALWRRQLILPPNSRPASNRDLARRIEVLWRGGFATEANALTKHIPAKPSPMLAALKATVHLSLARTKSGCKAVKQANAAKSKLSKKLRKNLLIQIGYCGIARNKKKAARLIADLARQQRAGNKDTVYILARVASNKRPNLSRINTLEPLAYRLLKLAKTSVPEAITAKATPAALTLMARDKTLAAAPRQRAGERAAALNLITAPELARIYEETTKSNSAPTTGTQSARAYAGARAVIAPFQKTRQLRNLFDASRRAGFYLAALEAGAPLVQTIRPAQEISWFSESAIESLTAAGQFQAARNWSNFAAIADLRGSANYGHWLALVNIADPASRNRARSKLRAVEAMALRGRFSPTALHRLATVLDALDYDIPVPLWEAASRSRQPKGGHLPKTGILKALQDAARRGDVAAVSLLAIETIGPKGSQGAHMIALGDTIRALRRAGMHRAARRLAFEALLPLWPRASIN